MNCFVQINSTNKAKNDIDTLMSQMGFKDLAVHGLGKGKIEVFFRKLFSAFNLLFTLNEGDILLMQYPFKKFFDLYCIIAHWKKAETVTLIHDLGTFRRKKLSASKEIKRLNHSDHIIAHNGAMKEWLEQNGTMSPICCLDIFDYLSDTEPQVHEHHSPHTNIAYAGGLYARKNSFLYDAGKALNGCKLNIYGRGDLDETRFNDNVVCHGRIASDQFIGTVNDDWGLVWDGDTVNGCGGTWGNYLRYNNPHKTSFYLRAGLPVIVWKQSAMAPFITSNKLGIAVESLTEIPSIVSTMTESDYKTIKANVTEMKEKLQSGYFFKKAWEAATDK